MNKSQYIINGLKLPSKLIELLKNDKWKAPKDKSGVKKILELPTYLKGRFWEFDIFGDFETYSLSLIRNESIAVKTWKDKKWIKSAGSMFLGDSDEIVKPGVIDVNKALLIANLGHGSDSPFTLDYRDDLDNPSVMIIRWGEEPNIDNRWMKIANSFDEFIEIVGIN